MLSPEFETINVLKEHVKELNKKLPEFSNLVTSGMVRFPVRELESMPPEYNSDFHEWLKNGAIDDFITRMSSTYKYFDADRHEERGGDPNKYVREKKRRVILGGLGSMWLDLPMVGTVNDKTVMKWTRVAFEYVGHWQVYFDPTADQCSFQDADKSKEYVRDMMTCGLVDIPL